MCVYELDWVFGAMKLLLAIVFVASAQVATAQPITTPVEAFNRAYLYTGFKEIKSMTPTAASAMASCERMIRDNTPFLNDSIAGRPVWLVQLKGVRIETSKWPRSWVERYNPKDFTAVIDSATGRLFKIYSTAEIQDSNLAPEPPPGVAAVEMKQTGEEYIGFPGEPPEVSFLQALGAASGSDPLRAREILAVCVIETDKFVDGGEPKVVWCITGRGIEPLDLHPTKAPLYMRNRRRTIIDATTGELIGITTSPTVQVRQTLDSDAGGSSEVVPKDSAGEKK